MITEWDIYWLTRMDALCMCLVILCSVATCAWSLWAFIFIAENKAFPKVSHFVLAAAVLCGIGRAFTPTTNEMAAIKVIPRLANNEDLKGVGSEITDLAKAWLKELKPKTEASK